MRRLQEMHVRNEEIVAEVRGVLSFQETADVRSRLALDDGVFAQLERRSSREKSWSEGSMPILSH